MPFTFSPPAEGDFDLASGIDHNTTPVFQKEIARFHVHTSPARIFTTTRRSDGEAFKQRIHIVGEISPFAIGSGSTLSQRFGRQLEIWSTAV
jgi:hypothetical protein